MIALTSREQREQTVSLLRGTLDDYLTTPFPVEELVSRLRLRVSDRMPVDRTVLRAGWSPSTPPSDWSASPAGS